MAHWKFLREGDLIWVYKKDGCDKDAIGRQRAKVVKITKKNLDEHEILLRYRAPREDHEPSCTHAEVQQGTGQV